MTIGIVHKNQGEMPTLLGRMPNVPGLPGLVGGAEGVALQGPDGVNLVGPPAFERAAATGTFWDRVSAKGYELGPAGLGAPIAHGMGLGAPIAHGMGLGATDADLEAAAKALASKGVNLSVNDIAGVMEELDREERNTLGLKLIALGVSAWKVNTAKSWVTMRHPKVSTAMKVYGVLSLISGPVCFYHGYKRNDSLGWGLAWWLFGSMFPVFAPLYAVVKKPGFANLKPGR